MGLYEVSFSMSLLGFGMEIMLINFYVCCIVLLLRAVFKLQEDLCVLCACCLVCHDPVSCIFYFVLLPLGPELW